MSNPQNLPHLKTGLYGLDETPAQFQARIVEINRLEILLKTQNLPATMRERVQAQLRLLTEINETEVDA